MFYFWFDEKSFSKFCPKRYNDYHPDRKISDKLCGSYTQSLITTAAFKKFSVNIRNLCMTTTFKLSVLLLFLAVTTAGCGQDDDQKKFEQEAFQLPEGITETEGNGSITSEDPDDWRTAPFFQGLVFVDPAFPNPVSVGDQLSLEIEVSGIDAVSGLTVAV
jgi:hypothetical protein